MLKQQLTIGIVGTGALGTQIALQLHKAGYHIPVIACRTKKKGIFVAKKIGCRIVTNPVELLDSSSLIFILTKDNQIAEIYNLLAESKRLTTSHLIGHCSGALQANVAPNSFPANLQTFSLHPMIAVPPNLKEEVSFKGVWWTFEGSPKAKPVLKTIVKQLNGIFTEITPENKPLYHASCVMSSGFIVTMLALAKQSLIKAGRKDKDAIQSIIPLALSAIQNLKHLPPEKSITGPVTRGDVKIINSHLKALSSLPKAKKVYQTLTDAAKFLLSNY